MVREFDGIRLVPYGGMCELSPDSVFGAPDAIGRLWEGIGRLRIDQARAEGPRIFKPWVLKEEGGENMSEEPITVMQPDQRLLDIEAQLRNVLAQVTAIWDRIDYLQRNIPPRKEG